MGYIVTADINLPSGTKKRGAFASSFSHTLFFVIRMENYYYTVCLRLLIARAYVHTNTERSLSVAFVASIK